MLMIFVRWSSLQQPHYQMLTYFIPTFNTFLMCGLVSQKQKYITHAIGINGSRIFSTWFDPPSIPSCRNRFSPSLHPPCTVYRHHKVGFFKNSITDTQCSKYYNNIHWKIALVCSWGVVRHRSCLWLHMCTLWFTPLNSSIGLMTVFYLWVNFPGLWLG